MLLYIAGHWQYYEVAKSKKVVSICNAVLYHRLSAGSPFRNVFKRLHLRKKRNTNLSRKLSILWLQSYLSYVETR